MQDWPLHLAHGGKGSRVRSSELLWPPCPPVASEAPSTLKPRRHVASSWLEVSVQSYGHGSPELGLKMGEPWCAVEGSWAAFPSGGCLWSKAKGLLELLSLGPNDHALILTQYIFAASSYHC